MNPPKHVADKDIKMILGCKYTFKDNLYIYIHKQTHIRDEFASHHGGPDPYWDNHSDSALRPWRFFKASNGVILRSEPWALPNIGMWTNDNKLVFVAGATEANGGGRHIPVPNDEVADLILEAFREYNEHDWYLYIGPPGEESDD